jgi:head-tail adaptor
MSIGETRHLVTFQDPGPPVSDGDGGATFTWTDLAPATWYVSVDPAAVTDQERLAADSVITKDVVLVRGAYHPGVSTATRMLFNGRTYAVAGVRNADARGIAMEVLAVET